MRKSILLYLIAAGCGGDGDGSHVVVGDFLARATPVRCDRVAPPLDLAVTEVRAVSDTSFLVLDEAQRRVAVLDDRLGLLLRVDYPASGPTAAEGAVSAALLGDTAVVIAARSPLRLVMLSRSGDPVRSVPLDFVPNSIEATPRGELLITPMPLGPRPGSLLVRYDGTGFHEVGIPPRPYDDMMIRALGNAALVETLPDGDALVVHQFLAPRGFRVAEGGAVTPLPVPTPDGTLEALSFVPTAPVTEDQMLRMLVPGMALSVDPLRGHVLLMTRSGRMTDGRPERAVLRLDDRLRFIDGFTLDVPAGRMTYLARREIALVVDDEDRFHACPLRDATAAPPRP